MESGNALLDSMIKEKKRRWEEVITSTNMTHNSRQAWKTIRMRSNGPTSPSTPCLVNANQVAHQLLVNGRGNMPSKPKRPVLPKTEAGTSILSPFSEDEYRKGVATLKNNKATGRDDVLVEQLKNLGPNAHKWLCAMLNNCFIDNKIPTTWRQSKIIAILKPGKDSAIPKSYRPIYIYPFLINWLIHVDLLIFKYNHTQFCFLAGILTNYYMMKHAVRLTCRLNL